MNRHLKGTIVVRNYRNISYEDILRKEIELIGEERMSEEDKLVIVHNDNLILEYGQVGIEFKD